MKSVFITFDQAFYERILALLDRQNCRGFSYWQQVQGRGSVKGEPHYGSQHGQVCVRLLLLLWMMRK